MGAIFGLGTDLGTIGQAGGFEGIEMPDIFKKQQTTTPTKNTGFDFDQANRIRGGI